MSTVTTQQPPAAASPITSKATSTSSLQILPLSKIVPSKTNPRKTFEGPEFDELVASIAQYGVLQPVLVRPMYDADDGELDHYELVAGERRYRASQKAGKDSIPAMAQLLTDREAMALQIIENLQRKDVSALEEAEGLHALLAAAEDDNSRLRITERSTRTELVQTIADSVGKSVRYVWARMKLVQLVPEVKAALAAGKIEPSHADVLVTFPAEKQTEIFIDNFTEPLDDEKAEGDLKIPCQWKGGEVLEYEPARYVENPLSVRELKRRLEQEGYELKKANWKWQKDVEGGTPGAVVDGEAARRCVGCEFNTATESGDVKHARCVNDECFTAKKNYFLQIEIQHVKAGGVEPIKVSPHYPGKKGVLDRNKWEVAKAGACDHVVPAVQVDDDGKAEKVLNVCATQKCKVHFGANPNTSGLSAAHQEAQKKAKQEREAENAVRLAIAKKVVAATTKLPEVAIRQLAHDLFDNWNVRDCVKELAPTSPVDIKKAKVDSPAFAKAIVAGLLAPISNVGEWQGPERLRKEFDAAVMNFGIDVAKERATLLKPAAITDKPKTKSKVPSSPKAAASSNAKTTKRATKKAAKKSSAKKGGR